MDKREWARVMRLLKRLGIAAEETRFTRKTADRLERAQKPLSD